MDKLDCLLPPPPPPPASIVWHFAEVVQDLFFILVHCDYTIDLHMMIQNVNTQTIFILRFRHCGYGISHPRFTLINIKSLGSTLATHFLFQRIEGNFKYATVCRTSALWDYYNAYVRHLSKNIIIFASFRIFRHSSKAELGMT